MTQDIHLSSDGLMLRPSLHDPCVKRRAAEAALKEIKEWIGKDLEPYETDEYLANQLAGCMGDGNGYEICKNMERGSWHVDARLVEIMDGGHIYDAERELVSQWVRCRGIVLGIPIGSEVEWKNRQGTVIRKDDTHATYCVHTLEQSDTQGWVCNAEDVRRLVQNEES